METSLSPCVLAEQAVARLRAGADPVRAAGARRYFKNQVDFLGLTTPQLRELAAELAARVRKHWTIDEVFQFCEALLPDRYHEPRGLAILVLTRFKKELGPDAFERIRRWLERDYLDNWALVDATCPELAGHLLLLHPALQDAIREWAGSPNRWVRRASLVSWLKLTKKRELLDKIYAMAEVHFSDPDDLIQKANGWLLREAGKTDVDRLEDFLRRHGPQIPRTTLRYAIERFPGNKRQALLTETRSHRLG